jgi:hypothetical protein
LHGKDSRAFSFQAKPELSFPSCRGTCIEGVGERWGEVLGRQQGEGRRHAVTALEMEIYLFLSIESFEESDILLHPFTSPCQAGGGEHYSNQRVPIEKYLQ